MTGKWAELLPTIPEGENYLYHTRRGGGLPLFGWRTRYWNFLLKLAKNRPSWTIQAQPGSATGPFHWTSRAEAQRLLGNAVPSLLAEVLAREIAAQLLDRPSNQGISKLNLQVRANMPGPEAVRPVSRPYLAMIDDHADHPGTGLGNRAVLRASAA